jgi:peptidoglycan/LPS O-acetylase OafA/YrhL
MQLSATSIYPYFLISTLLLLGASTISNRSKFYRELLDSESASTRFLAIDGLRGFLALGVFFGHALTSYFYYVEGRWIGAHSKFYSFLAQGGVGLFFMITAFLFWNKGLQARPFLQVQTMLWSRVCRLTPLYFFSMATVIAIAVVITDFQIQQTVPMLIRQICALLSFGFISIGEINGFQEGQLINAGVQWTLRYEWLFYLFLPLGLLFKKGWGFLILSVVASLIIQAFSVKAVEWFFLFGSVAALLVSSSTFIKLQPKFWNSKFVTFILLIIFPLLATTISNGYGFSLATLLFLLFICIANGNDLFGLLTSRPARFLGTISYSIYLMHGIVLFVALRSINRIIPIPTLTPAYFWIVVTICAAFLVFVCSITYRFIEHPFLKVSMPRWLVGNSVH